MELDEFLRQTQTDVRAQTDVPYPELVFTEIVMQHMSEIGMTFEPVVCHYLYERKGKGTLRLSGYAISEDDEQLDLFVSLYEGVQTLTPIAREETVNAAEQCIRFLKSAADGTLLAKMEETHEAYGLVLNIKERYNFFEQIRIYVLTDRQAKAKNFQDRDVGGKTVKLEVMDIERLYRHWAAGKPRDELVLDLQEICGGPIPCVYVPGQMTDYDYALTALPGEALRIAYEKHGARLLEANVRSFLSVTGKVNRGIRDTLRDDPERFMAYNNGIVLVVDDIRLAATEDGAPGILRLNGMQVVNGGQTTASIYFTKKRTPEVDLSRVRVPAKIIVLRSKDGPQEESLISDISKYANSQNAVKTSDLSANKPFHVEIEKLALSTYCPDGVSRWFYERAAGSYNTLLAREGTTPARLKALKEAIPSARKITKTDLAKYLRSWDCQPDSVSFGSQKNFERFMTEVDADPPRPLPSVPEYKRMIAKAILFKKVQRIIRPMFPAFQANVATYTVSLLAHKLGGRMDFDIIWNRQSTSARLDEQIGIWAREVHDLLQHTANGRMVSEWAKKRECWEDHLKVAAYSDPMDGIPEVR